MYIFIKYVLIHSLYMSAVQTELVMQFSPSYAFPAQCSLYICMECNKGDTDWVKCPLVHRISCLNQVTSMRHEPKPPLYPQFISYLKRCSSLKTETKILVKTAPLSSICFWHNTSDLFLKEFSSIVKTQCSTLSSLLIEPTSHLVTVHREAFHLYNSARGITWAVLQTPLF